MKERLRAPAVGWRAEDGPRGDELAAGGVGIGGEGGGRQRRLGGTRRSKPRVFIFGAGWTHARTPDEGEGRGMAETRSAVGGGGGGGWGWRRWLGRTRERTARQPRLDLERKGWVGRWVRVLVFQEKIHRWMGA